MKNSLFVIALSVALFVGCKSEQEKALDEAIASKELSTLREFGISNTVMEEKVQIKYDSALGRLIKDSTMYAAIEQAGSSLQKYVAEKEYIAALPKGNHASEVKASMYEHKEAADKVSEKLNKIKKAFQQYKFIEVEEYEEEIDTYEFDIPNASGEGSVTIAATPFRFRVPWVGSVLVSRQCSANYYVNDDLMIVMTIKEIRSYSDIKGSDKEFLKDYAMKSCPSPVSRKLVLGFNYDTDFPSIF